jgi:hypothetical protein
MKHPDWKLRKLLHIKFKELDNLYNREEAIYRIWLAGHRSGIDKVSPKDGKRRSAIRL